MSSEDAERNVSLTELGYSSTKTQLTLEERKTIGANVEYILKSEKEAARAPTD